MKFLKIFLFLSVIVTNASSQQNENYYRQFIADLINDKDDLTKYFSEDEINKSERLKINYENVKFKSLISYDIDKNIKEKIISNDLSYSVSVNNTYRDFTLVVFSIDELNLKKSFYFKDGKLVFPSTYFADNWKNIRSEYFNFYISDSLIFNQYCADHLDKFAEHTLDLLKAGAEEKKLLQKEKIIYVFCKDENEIGKITGFNTKGIYLLSEDAVVTTYNSHTHEVSHLLINYKLKTLPLYTLPFIQEGFAVATGGRGGLSSDVLMDVGYYTMKTKFADVTKMLTKKDFQSEDPSITYPASGLINQYLIKQMGIERYMDIYKQLSGNAEFLSSLDPGKIKDVILFDKIYEHLIDDYKYQGGILFEINEKTKNVILKNIPGEISGTEHYYRFQIDHSVFFSDKKPLMNYKSKLFSEIFPDRSYNGEKYFLNLNPGVIKLYNFYNNELIASYDSGFNTSKEKIPVSFFINKNFFDGNLEDLIITK